MYIIIMLNSIMGSMLDVFQPTVWNHVSLTRDEAYVSLYINNNPTATGAQALAGKPNIIFI